MNKPTAEGVLVLLRGLVLLSIIILLCGCASYEKYSSKFKKSTHADVAFFANNTIAMVGDADFELTSHDAIYTREFFDPSGIEEQRLLDLLTETDILLKGLVRYSIILVSITDAAKTETERIDRYANHLDNLDKWIENSLVLLNQWIEESGELHMERYNAVVANVRNQEKFLDALNEAQPLIVGFGHYAELLFEEIDEAIEVLVLKIDQRIDEKYKSFIVYHEQFLIEKYAVLEALRYLYLTYRGDKEAFDLLLSTNALRDTRLIPQNRPPNENELRSIAEHLGTRLDDLHRIEKELQNDWDAYWASHRELDRLHKEVIVKTNRARILFLVWVSAHAKMASGVVNRAEWFDFSEIPSTLLRSGTNLLF